MGSILFFYLSFINEYIDYNYGYSIELKFANYINLSIIYNTLKIIINLNFELYISILYFYNIFLDSSIRFLTYVNLIYFVMYLNSNLHLYFLFGL